MDCEQFRAAYSDFADGSLDEMGEIMAYRHMSECTSCRRFHEALTWGIRELRERPQVLPSADFAVKLERRLKAEPAPLAGSGRPGAAAAAMLMGLTVVAAGMFAYDVAHRPLPAPVRAGAMGPLPVLGANAFQPTLRYVSQSITKPAPFVDAARADELDGADTYAAPALLMGGIATR